MLQNQGDDAGITDYYSVHKYIYIIFTIRTQRTQQVRMFGQYFTKLSVPNV